MISTNHQAKLKELIRSAVRSHASDLHLSVGTAPTIRVNQRLHTLMGDIIVTTEFVQEAAIYLAELGDQDVKRGAELYFAVNLEPGLRAKITVFYQKGLPAVTLKFIPHQIKNIDQLVLPKQAKQFSELSHGLVIVAGPYGSGRSTTLAAFIQSINATRREYIVTLERPIEYIFTSQFSIIEQREIGRDTANFEEALRYLKHEDVDVVMISELSSPASVMLALEIASAHALVFASLEGGSVTKIIDRIINLFDAQKQGLVRRLFADVLKGILVQRLLPRIGGGLVPAVELLTSTGVFRDSIKKGKIDSINNMLATSRSGDMISLDRSLLELARKKIITRDDALAEAFDREMLSRLINQ